MSADYTLRKRRWTVAFTTEAGRARIGSVVAVSPAHAKEQARRVAALSGDTVVPDTLTATLDEPT